MLDAADVDGTALSSEDAVPLALPLVVADQRADQGQRVVLEQDFARLENLPVQQKADGLGKGDADGAPHGTLRVFAPQTAFCFVDDM